MTVISVSDPEKGTRLKGYSALTKAGKTVVKLEIELTDYYELGFTMRQLDQATENQFQYDLAAKRAAQEAKKASQKAIPLALPAPQRALPHPEDR